jgi:hypothetical protein
MTTVTGSVTFTAPASPMGPTGPTGSVGVAGPAGSSPTAAAVAAILAGTPSFVAAVAAALGTAIAPVASPSGTVVKAGSTAAIVDGSGNKWTITASGMVAVNTVADTSTSGVVQIAYVTGTVWQQNNADLWWGKTSPTAAWSPSAGTATSPISPPVVTPPVVIPPVVTPPATTGATLINQGGPNNASQNGASLSNSQTIVWAAMSGADSYQIYRNGTAYATTKALTYTDSAATNSNDVMPNDFSGTHFNAPRTVYTYTVAPITAGVIGAQVACNYWEYANGVDSWGKSAFNPSTSVMNYADTTLGKTVISVASSVADGYVQPSAGAPGTPLWSFEAGAFGYMVIDIYPTKANQQFKVNLISRVTPGDFYNNAAVLLGTPTPQGSFLADATWGPSPMVANKWNHYKIPFSALAMGFVTFKGYIAGKLLTVTSVSGSTPINPTFWVSAPGMTTDYIVGPGPSDGGSSATGKGGIGTYDMNVSQTVGSAAAPVTFTAQRTNIYKWSIQDNNQQGANLWYMDNIGFTV